MHPERCVTLTLVFILDELRRRRELSPDLKLLIDIDLHLPAQELVDVGLKILTIQKRAARLVDSRNGLLLAFN